jgi:hypothetical protein
VIATQVTEVSPERVAGGVGRARNSRSEVAPGKGSESLVRGNRQAKSATNYVTTRTGRVRGPKRKMFWSSPDKELTKDEQVFVISSWRSSLCQFAKVNCLLSRMQC